MHEALSDPELQRVLWACLNLAGAPNRICYSWIERRYKRRFGGTFHQSRLHHLARLGLLAKDGETTRGRSRRYYQISVPNDLATRLRAEGYKKCFSFQV